MLERLAELGRGLKLRLCGAVPEACRKTRFVLPIAPRGRLWHPARGRCLCTSSRRAKESLCGARAGTAAALDQSNPPLHPPAMLSVPLTSNLLRAGTEAWAGDKHLLRVVWFFWRGEAVPYRESSSRQLPLRSGRSGSAETSFPLLTPFVYITNWWQSHLAGKVPATPTAGKPLCMPQTWPASRIRASLKSVSNIYWNPGAIVSEHFRFCASEYRLQQRRTLHVLAVQCLRWSQVMFLLGGEAVGIPFCAV